ncbi:hypothetical protein B0H19DRAFT_853210, partial [Mycena capillaripes]
LRARLYTTSIASPSFISVYTRSSSDSHLARYPCVESVMGSCRIQPYVHDVTVLLRHGAAVSRFRIYFKRHKHMPAN